MIPDTQDTPAISAHAQRLAFGPLGDLPEPSTTAAQTIPEGFEEMPTFGPFHALLGPMYFRRTEDQMIVGLHVEDKHRNRGQMMHGGMICTLADTASHWAAKNARQPTAYMLTTGLSVNLMGNAAPGEWVEARVDVLRAGRSIVFTNCQIFSGGRTIASASAQFQVTAPK
jgi:uncharacterized protein (TIGR00369 family)